MQLKRTRSSGTHRRRLWTLVATLLGVAIILAACGTGEVAGSGSDVEPTTTADPATGDVSDIDATAADGVSGDSSQDDAPRDALAFANCMRANGVPNFPDPIPGGTSGGGGFRMDASIADNPNFPTARANCEHLIPDGGTNQAGQADPEVVLAFAQCMRENGVPSFPDPATGGGMALGGDLGIDPSSPQFQNALEICREQTGLTINIRPSP